MLVAFPGHSEDFPILGMNRDNSEGILNISFGHVTACTGPCSSTKKMASFIQIYWRVKSSMGILAFKLFEDFLGRIDGR